MIKKTGVPAKHIAMAAPDRIDFDPISDRLIPSFVSPIATTPSRIRFTIISDVMLMILFLCFARGTGEFGFVPLYERIRVTIDIQTNAHFRLGDHASVKTEVFLLPVSLSARAAKNDFQSGKACWLSLVLFLLSRRAGIDGQFNSSKREKQWHLPIHENVGYSQN